MKPIKIEVKDLEIDLQNHTVSEKLIPGPKGEDGKDGETPTEEQLLALILPNIPKPKNGKDGKSITKTEVKEIIKSVLPEDKLIEKIVKKIPVPKDGEDGKSFRFADLTAYEKQILTGPPGSTGVGVPRGGTANQVLSKRSSRDFDTEWVTGGGGGGTVETVTGLNTDNADPLNPIVKISVDGTTITGLGTPASPLVAVGDGTGDVHGPASSTDNAITRFDSTTGKIIQNSGITIADGATGTLSGTNSGDVTVSDSAEIDFTLTGQQISASIVASSIDESKLDASVNASLDLADTAVQPAGLTNYFNKTTDDTDDITDTATNRFTDDTAITRLANTSGTNTGDNATNSQYSGLATSKQDTLVSGTNIKTVNGNSLLGSGNIVITGGTGDVTGPASSTDGVPALFDGTTGKAIKNSTPTGTGNPVMDTNPTFVTRINAPEIKATNSAGVDIHNNSGTQVALFGAGGGTGASIVGTTNIGSASADYHQVAGGTGTITDTATGSSTDINVNIVPKGTGRLQAGGVNVPTISSTDTLSNKSISLGSNTVTTTKAQLNTAVTDGDVLFTDAIGSTVQAYDADLTTWAGITPGTGVGTALAVNIGTAGAVVTNGGALGTPSSGVATNLTGTASGLTAGDSTKIGGITVTGTPAVGYVPTATSTSAATWQAPSGGAGWVTIGTGTLASANATLMDVTSISSTYDTFRITICWLNSSSSSRDIWLRFNNDSGGNYATESTYFSSSTITASRESSQSKIRLNIGQTVMTSSTNHYTITVSKPTTGMPASINFDGKINNTSSVVKIFGSADWNNTSAKIDRIKIQDEDGTGVFDTGSFYILEGYVVT